ncbi:MAG TPA: ATP-dependent DNA helicase RecG [Solirubrobacteraceae bacterium]|nr:ATP-dependent DNA helicase RecG [Solirubrobacteraceae bacterium]
MRTQEPDSVPSTARPANRLAAASVRAFASGRSLSREELLAAPVRWPRPSRLRASLEPASKRMAAGMEALSIGTVGELLEHLPSDIREARSIAALRAGEQATVAVQVRAIAARAVRRRRMRPLVEATVFDASGTMRATFFNQPWLAERYAPGTRLLLHGKADDRQGFRVSHHAELLAGAGDDGAGSAAGDREPSEGSGDSVAHYPAAQGISSTQILTLVRDASAALADVPEPLSAATRVSERLPDRACALAAMHFPRGSGDPRAGRERLAFEELLLEQLVFLRRRAGRSAQGGGWALGEEPSLSERWLRRELPFQPTGDQLAAIDEIRADLAQSRPMQRLLLGEVGSGKTVVALYAMLRAVEHGCQAALMAPTETLAEQHFATLQRLIGAEPLTAALLTGSTGARRRKDALGKLASGELSLLVGTHALIEPDVRFRALAVAVVDEQHRFGVRQRAALEERDPARPPHVLHMTATPIPRTLALARYGDLDVSTLRELPLGRTAVDTRLVAGDQARARAYEHLREQLRAGRQAYVVCPLIEDPEQAPGAGDSAAGGRAAPAESVRRAARAELLRLRAGELEGYELALLHGGMRSGEKQEAMAAFASGQAQVLVATTVIEVGIDVPNATVMLIENAEQFGISQLHQLRGRVGRGEHPGVCFLVGPAGGSEAGHHASGRLRALVTHSDGFRLAEIDLGLRREGELVGTRQSGFVHYRVASLPEDAQLLERARARAEAIIAQDPELRTPEHVLLGDALELRFGAQALEPIPA